MKELSKEERVDLGNKIFILYSLIPWVREHYIMFNGKCYQENEFRERIYYLSNYFRFHFDENTGTALTYGIKILQDTYDILKNCHPVFDSDKKNFKKGLKEMEKLISSMKQKLN